MALAAVSVPPWLKGRKRRRLRSLPFPAPWRAILESRVPAYLRLPGDLRSQLEQHMQVFLAGLKVGYFDMYLADVFVVGH